MYLIQISHGEYDDFRYYPLMIVPNDETAKLVVEECYNPKGMFRQKISNCLGYPEGISDVCFEGCGFSYEELEFYEIT